MRRLVVSGLILFGAIGIGRFLFASVPAESSRPDLVESYTFIIADAPVVSAVDAYIVIDEETGEVLLEHNADTIRPMASVAKLLVAGVALQTDMLSATTTISNSDVATEESFGNLSTGEVYSLRELLFPYLLESSNDAGATIERVWSSDIEEGMRRLLEKTNLATTVELADYTGLSSQTMASPRSLAFLTRTLAQTVPELFDITVLPRYVGHTTTLTNNSPVLEQADYQGGKHGYTAAAGKTLVARLQSTFQDGDRTLIYVLLGGDSHRDNLAELRTYVASTVTRAPQNIMTSDILPVTHNE